MTILPLSSLQPRPAGLIVAKMPVAGRTVTAITRIWAEGDEARCRLCPPGKCGASKGSCLVIVPRDIPGPDCSLFSVAEEWRKGGAR